MLIFMSFFRVIFRSQVLFRQEIYQDLKIEQEETNDSNRERQLFIGTNCGQFLPIPALPMGMLFSDFLLV